jgi:hypothetical protein
VTRISPFALDPAVDRSSRRIVTPSGFGPSARSHVTVPYTSTVLVDGAAPLLPVDGPAVEKTALTAMTMPMTSSATPPHPQRP